MGVPIEQQHVPGDVNLPIIPDKVAAKIRKGQDVPLEEVSEAAVGLLEETNASRRKPVHAGDLKPITKAQAASLVSGTPDGKLRRGAMPNAPATRRVIPDPFRRPSVNLQVPGEPRPDWGYCRADRVQEGDIIPDLGRVVAVESRIRYAPAEEQVPVTVYRAGEDGPDPLIHKTFEGPEYEALAGKYGSTQVAIGYEILLTGAGGKVLALDAGDQARVFRIQDEGGSGG